MAEKPTYEALKKRIAELERQVDQNNSAGLTNPPELFSFLIEAFRHIPICTTFEDAAREIFKYCKRLTGARSGYVALLSENGEGNEVLFLDTGGMPCDVDPNLPMPIRGLRKTAYRTKEVAYDNSFPESPWMEYMPEGHVKLDNVLFAPLNIKNKTVGVIGIANKDGGFNEYDVHISKILGDLAAVALSYARAQENLRQNEAKLRSMLNASPLAIVLLNRSGRILDSNEEHASRLNVSRDETLGRCLWELLPKEVLTHRRRQVESVFETGRPYTGEDKRGAVWNQYHIHPAIIDHSGKVQAVIVEAIDITERKMVEKKLSQIFTMSMDMLCIADIHRSSFIKVNPAFSETLGFSESELLGNSFLDFIHPEDIDATRSIINKKLKMGEKVINFENRYQCKDGKYRWLSWVSHPDTEEGVTYAAARDITEQKQQEQALNHSKAILDATGRMAKVGGWEVHADTMEVTWTEETYRIHEVPFDEKPSLQGAINFFHPADRPTLEQAVQRALDSGEPYDMELRFVTARGNHLWTHTICQPVIINGKVTKLTGTFQDITDRKQAEKILQKNHEMLKRTEAMASIGSWEWDVQQDRVYWSEELFRIFGRDPAEEAPCFAEQSEFYANGDMQRLKDAVKICIKRGTSYEIELRAVRPDGEIRHCISRGQPQYDENENVFRLTGSFQDVTERKKAEEALKSNYTLLQIAGETAIFGGWSVDLEHNICIWSDAVADIHDVPHGYAPSVQEAINFYAPEWQEKITHIFSACAKDGIPYDEEMEIITQKGNRVWVRATGKAVKNEKDKIIKVQGSFQDITEKKQAEDALRESEEKLHALFSAMTEMVVLHQLIFDDNGMPCNYRILDCNQAFCRITKITKETAVGKTATQVYNTNLAPYLDVYAKVALSGEPVEFVTYYTSMDKHFLVSVVSPRKNYFATITSDITEIRKAEAEREKLQAQLNQAQKLESVGRLAGGVAHDFNNMLGVILGHTELALLKTDKDNDLVSDLNEIQNAATRSADITKQLLAFARKQTISPRQIDLNDTVEHMLNMLRRLIGEDIDLVWKPAAHIWPVKMDPSQIDQILANLCVNTRDAIAGVGKFIIETGKKSFDDEYCRQHSGFTPGDFVLLAVSDNGCGMDKNTMDNMFEPFFTTKDVGKGTGLGLATIYGIVKQNNGFINVYSEPGHGSTFKIYLPRSVENKETSKTVHEKKSAEGTETILLVEDEPSILRITRIMLEKKGYCVLPADRPAEAVEKAKNHSGSIDLLMTDVVMPEMNGRALAGQITKLYPGIRLLFMSGYTANVIAHHGVLDDGVAFIQKPFSMADMAEKVRDILDESKKPAT
ncbi:MAG: PAS domain S-box protein [Desulfotignum sp.]|nr:PAS domain S-box protein [Desulfotignum sp.]MCF8137727.1 PAS domain S-box protein [Desulfotignum sp.]